MFSKTLTFKGAAIVTILTFALAGFTQASVYAWSNPAGSGTSAQNSAQIDRDDQACAQPLGNGQANNASSVSAKNSMKSSAGLSAKTSVKSSGALSVNGNSSAAKTSVKVGARASLRARLLSAEIARILISLRTDRDDWFRSMNSIRLRVDADNAAKSKSADRSDMGASKSDQSKGDDGTCAQSTNKGTSAGTRTADRDDLACNTRTGSMNGSSASAKGSIGTAVGQSGSVSSNGLSVNGSSSTSMNSKVQSGSSSMSGKNSTKQRSTDCDNGSTSSKSSSGNTADRNACAMSASGASNKGQSGTGMGTSASGKASTSSSATSNGLSANGSASAGVNSSNTQSGTSSAVSGKNTASGHSEPDCDNHPSTTKQSNNGETKESSTSGQIDRDNRLCPEFAMTGKNSAGANSMSSQSGTTSMFRVNSRSSSTDCDDHVGSSRITGSSNGQTRLTNAQRSAQAVATYRAFVTFVANNLQNNLQSGQRSTQFFSNAAAFRAYLFFVLSNLQSYIAAHGGFSSFFSELTR